MGYDQAQFTGIETIELTVPVSTSTFTASNHVLTAANVTFAPLHRASLIIGASGVVTAVGQSASPKIIILSGTSTAAVIPLVNTAGSNAVNNAITSTISVGNSGVIAISVISTGTASAAQTNPVANLSIRVQEQFQ